ncbi:hypothetical protein XELAEV_18005901mg [Xenopus laevis]|uniref:Ubiquitin-like modifier-activating enzyme 6 n=1 Tax=Xenopus laevis TaxID=8355 RepID=A0A974I3K7_XENLA|nr:hypothetical protein XELAEV_18005901mg [Xenopus laevis]
MAAESIEIDDGLYSRQRYVLGDTAMQKMAQSHVFLSGMGGLGVEIAKNIVLAGIKTLTVHDNRKCEMWDLGTNFFIKEEDVKHKKNRAETCLPHIAELNPYVHVMSSTVLLDDLSFLKHFQCVILTETRLSLRKKICNFCHAQQPPIKFISSEAFGICAYLFCDFGNEFEVTDTTGEEPKEIFISNITQSTPGVVTCFENRPHKLENGQLVTFREVNGMTSLNGSRHQITVISPYSFSIGDTANMEPYQHGGIAVQLKMSKTFSFETLEKQLENPTYLTVDFSKPEAPLNIHTAMLALDYFQEKHNRLPNIGCLLDAEEMQKLAESVTEVLKSKPLLDDNLVKWLSWTAQGLLTPLAAAMGGIVSQEILKAVTGKFSPLQQWVGCGAIGCEMLKNFALLGAGSGSEGGLITVTDPDLIEKSNLNRQFLFRPKHIQKPKSYTASAATLNINPHLKIDPRLDKVCPATENIFDDEFYNRQDVIVTALDNVEARRYIDSRSVTNLRPLLDSGTMGTKGHTEVIVPHLTESYNSYRDPLDEEIPFCTLKSFPATIEHTIQWARDKFESSFSHKPSLYNTFWQTHSSAEHVLQSIQSGESLEGCFHVVKLLNRKPRNWTECVKLARHKFEKYFSHKAQQLLHSFPLDTRLNDGTLFWQSPKRPPTPVQFDAKDQLHISFIVSAAKLFAEVHSIPLTEKDVSKEAIAKIISEMPIKEFTPSNKIVETDETVRKPDQITVSSEDERTAVEQLEKAIADRHVSKSDLQLMPLSFEKDDDSNEHISFITAASNLRAKMYNIDSADRFKTKRIAGKIIPAIATATAAVSGLVALELIKVIGGGAFEVYRNCFFNLAIPIIVFTEAAEVKRTNIRNGISFTIWDRWTIYGKEDFTLLDFINAVKEQYGIEPTMVIQGVKMLYVPVMPGHAKRLKLTMHKLVKPGISRKYVDLTVSFAPERDEEEDLPGPPVRYYFNQEDN